MLRESNLPFIWLESNDNQDSIKAFSAELKGRVSQSGYHTSTSVAPQLLSPPQISPSVPR